MKKIQMVDLKGQYDTIQEQIDSKVLEVIQSSAFINGPEVHNFQKELEDYLDVKHVIPCANGTDALQISMMGLGLQSGGEVITADFTFAATVEVIALLHLTPVLVDVEKDTFNIDIAALKKAITSKTKAIVPVHLFGQCANMEAVLEVAKEFDLFVIEDNAQAIGADYTFKDGSKMKSGTIGNVGTTSFFPAKNLGCYGDGGAIFTNDDALAHTLRGMVNHGMYRRYYHDVVGVNSRLDSLQAAVLRIKLPLLDSYCESRKKAAEHYSNAFAKNKNIVTPVTSSFSTHVFHQYTIRVTTAFKLSRDKLKEKLLEMGIESAIFYPKPLHLYPQFTKFGYKEGDFPVAESLSKQVLSLPVHPTLNENDMKKIADTIKLLSK